MVCLFLIAGACATQAAADTVLQLIKVGGQVNTTEIGGSGLRVFSLWDKAQGEPVHPDGSFVTVIADSRPQKISLKDDKKKTRALALALPGSKQAISFDAVSTAVAMLFQDPGQFGNSAQAQRLAAKMAQKQSFCNLVDFLRKRLARMTLEELAGDAECTVLVEQCNTEIFGQDDQAIRNSLRGAQHILERDLP